MAPKEPFCVDWLFMAGIDTDGGVRVPAGYCGILGFQPSFGAVSHMGIIPVSQSLDVVGMPCPFM